jgi:thiosulfate/3-mercaptopyruvate sulfurtransferase
MSVSWMAASPPGPPPVSPPIPVRLHGEPAISPHPPWGVGHLLDATGATRYAAGHLLLDARPADRFRGENEAIDAVAGHIPGAVSAPALANIDKHARFLPAEELARRFHELGAEDGNTVGTYCGSGVQATHLALALSIAGITGSADVYIGSWSDWITSPDRPIARG